MLAVPDMDRDLPVDAAPEAATVQVQYQLMRMLFGGQTDAWDYHKTGFTRGIAWPVSLAMRDFDEVRPRRDGSDLFDDTSEPDRVGDVPA